MSTGRPPDSLLAPAGAPAHWCRSVVRATHPVHEVAEALRCAPPVPPPTVLRGPLHGRTLEECTEGAERVDEPPPPPPPPPTHADSGVVAPRGAHKPHPSRPPPPPPPPLATTPFADSGVVAAKAEHPRAAGSQVPGGGKDGAGPGERTADTPTRRPLPPADACPPADRLRELAGEGAPRTRRPRKPRPQRPRRDTSQAVVPDVAADDLLRRVAERVVGRLPGSREDAHGSEASSRQWHTGPVRVDPPDGVGEVLRRSSHGPGPSGAGRLRSRSRAGDAKDGDGPVRDEGGDRGAGGTSAHRRQDGGSRPEGEGRRRGQGDPRRQGGAERRARQREQGAPERDLRPVGRLSRFAEQPPLPPRLVDNNSALGAGGVGAGAGGVDGAGNNSALGPGWVGAGGNNSALGAGWVGVGGNNSAVGVSGVELERALDRVLTDAARRHGIEV